jgi:spore coat protein U-like protein
MTSLAAMKHLGLCAAALSMLCCPTVASARSSGNVTCGVTVTPLQFGEYVPFLGAPTDFTATLTVTCTTTGTAAEPWNGTIALIGAGRQSGRQLRQGSHPLDYKLYQNPARTMPWGDGGSDGAVLPMSGTVGPTTPYRHTMVIYGRIPAMQTSATVGRYSDQITVLLDY